MWLLYNYIQLKRPWLADTEKEEYIKNHNCAWISYAASLMGYKTCHSLLNQNETINVKKYNHQLEILHTNLQKRLQSQSYVKGVLLLHVNPNLHMTPVSQRKKNVTFASSSSISWPLLYLAISFSHHSNIFIRKTTYYLWMD